MAHASSEIALDALGAAPVLDIEGRERLLGSTWAERPALLVFIRHFG